MSGQTSYAFEPAIAIEGMIADSGVRDVISRLLESTVSDAGLFHVKGTATDQLARCSSTSMDNQPRSCIGCPVANITDETER